MSPTITADVQVPPRSRTFTEDDAKAVLALLRGEKAVTDDEGNPVLDDDGQPIIEQVEPSKNVGFGEFDKQGAARSAGVSLNKILVGTLGAPHPYAVTTFERGGKIVGVLLNKPAKAKKEQAEETPAPAPAPEPEKPAPAQRGASTAAQRSSRRGRR